MELLIVTGMSGAGKSQAANALEDIGFYCVDNIPPAIIPSFVELSARSGDLLNKMAIVTDMRGGALFSEIDGVLGNLKRNNIEYKILFLDAADDVLIRRYKENRRKHPLADGNNMSVAAAIAKEREMLKKIRFSADYVVDTSRISISQLKVQLSNIFFGSVSNVLKIQCKSFGFKYGSDTEADLVVDVRCLPNPFYVEELKEKTGLDKESKVQIAKIESLLSTIARQGRAFGIHLILATQRPDADILKGQIKNNIDFRICGRADKVLSQIILDNPDGAEKIPKDKQGIFLTNTGVLFKAYYFDDSEW